MTAVHHRPEAFANAWKLHGKLSPLDGHLDIPAHLAPFDRESPGAFDLDKAAAGGLAGAVLAITARASRPTAEGLAAGRAQQEAIFGAIADLARDHPARTAIVRSPQDYREAVASQKLALVLGFQNAAPIEGLADIERWIERGIALFAFSFIGDNQWATSARPYPFLQGHSGSPGLSRLGTDAVSLLNDRGVLVDVSQLSSRSFDDVLATSRLPVVNSHAAPRAFVDTDRNMTDAELAALAANGGVVNIVGFPPYLRAPDAAMIDRLRNCWQHYGLARPARLADLLSVNDPATADWDEEKFWDFLHAFHVVLELDKPVAALADHARAIEHAVSVAGVDHVGIASDFNHAGGVLGWRTVADTVNVTVELLSRGFSEADLEKIWSGNFLRIWQAAIDGRR